MSKIKPPFCKLLKYSNVLVLVKNTRVTDFKELNYPLLTRKTKVNVKKIKKGEPLNCSH